MASIVDQFKTIYSQGAAATLQQATGTQDLPAQIDKAETLATAYVGTTVGLQLISTIAIVTIATISVLQYKKGR